MGRLNVFGPDLIGGNKTLLWRLAGDQGSEWRTGTVRLEASTSQHFHEVKFFLFLPRYPVKDLTCLYSVNVARNL